MAITAERQELAATFRKNFQRLLSHHWISQRELADAVDARYKWVRRLAHEGIVYADRRTKDKLDDIAYFFGITTDEFWNAHLKLRKPPADNWVLIPWMGSKRKQSELILSHFPKTIATYWEPFLGGGSMFKSLLESSIKVERFRLSDRCRPLIGIWKLVKDDPRTLIERYDELWHKYQESGERLYRTIRVEFNQTCDPCLFYFLTRTCRNGMPRFNRNGEFNTAPHHGLKGLHPQAVKRVAGWWNERLQDIDVKFGGRDYKRISTRQGDFLYADPPYEVSGRYYYGRFDLEPFFGWLSKQSADYALSLNGHVDNEPQTVAVPKELFDRHTMIRNGVSITKRLAMAGEVQMVDSLYLRSPCSA